MRVPPTYHRSCGPAALATIAGVSRHEAAELLYRRARDLGFKTFKSTQMITMRRTLKELGYELKQVETSYSVAAWFRSRAFATGTWLIVASRHFMVVHDGVMIEDNGRFVRRGAIRLLYRIEPSPDSTGNVATFADRMDAAAYRASQSSALRSGQRQTTGRTASPMTAPAHNGDVASPRVEVDPWFDLGDVVEIPYDATITGGELPLYRVIAVKQVNLTVENEEGKRFRVNKRGVRRSPRAFTSQVPDRPRIGPGTVGTINAPDRVRGGTWEYDESTKFVVLADPRSARLKVAQLNGDGKIWTIPDNTFNPA